jgi:predicted phage terminase large subunit-like protein
MLTHADLIAVEREFCSRKLSHFVRRAWHVLEPAAELKWGWAADAICDHLEAVTRGEIKELLINVPPGMMKSLLTSVFWPAWEWGPKKMPVLRYVATAHNANLATRDNLKCRRLITSEWYQSLFDVELTGDQNEKTKFENTATGFRQSCAFTSMTGVRGDRVILDDPNSVHDGNSVAKLLDAELAFLETLPTRVNNENSAKVVIQQRVAENDISGIIKAKELNYAHLCLPMRFEPERRCTTFIFTDPRTKDGELLFPELFSEERVAGLEKTLGSHAAAGQLQMRPSPRGGNVWKVEWLRFYSVLPPIEFRFITADTANKTGTQNDYTVFQCWGRSVTGHAVLIDQLRGKWEEPDVLKMARLFWLKHKARSNCGELRAMYVEDKSSGTAVVQTLRREGIAVLPVQRNTDKYTRYADAAPFIESGNMLIPEHEPWVADYIAEYSTVPASANDDQADPTADAIKIVQMAPATKTAAASAPQPRTRW